jgi:glutamyl-tRNA synthetase
MRDLLVGDIIQLERKGYYRVDEAASPSKPMLLFAIPDGRQKK